MVPEQKTWWGAYPGHRATLELAAGLLPAALGLLALLGWATGAQGLATLGAGSIPMAPSTALLFLADGAGLGLLAWWSRGGAPRGRRAGLLAGIAGVTAAVAGLFVALRLASHHPGWERGGLEAPPDLLGAPLGHMSVVTAAGFVLVGLSFLLVLARGGRSALLRAAALGTAAALTAAAAVLLLAYLYGEPVLYGGRFIPPALGTAAAFGALGLGLFVQGLRPRPGEDQAAAGGEPSGVWLLLGFALLSAALVATGHYTYRAAARSHRAEVERQLLAIADLKVDEIMGWRRERLGDAAVFHRNAAFASLVRRSLHAEGAQREKARRRVLAWIGEVQRAYEYAAVFLLDPRGTVRLSAPARPEPPTRALEDAAARCLREGRVTILDLHRDRPGGPIHLSVLVPIVDLGEGSASPPTPRPLGVLVLRIDPGAHLYPMLRRWPVPSETAEVLLARREGDHAVYLNELRFRKHGALELRWPISDVRLPVVKALLGWEGIVGSVDYREVPVIAAVRKVPRSPWALVARIDVAEVDAPLHGRLWEIALLVGALLLGSAASFGTLWRRQRLRFYREQYQAAEALRTSERELLARNDELTRFTYTVSHDLKSPLVTIQTFVGYLEQDLAAGDGDRVAVDLGYVRTAAAKMSELLEDLLRLSRVGRLAAPPEDIRLQDLVEEALAVVGGQIRERGVAVEVTEAPVWLRGDRVRLGEVLQNLLDNAVKFMGDQAEPRIAIGVEEAPVPSAPEADRAADAPPGQALVLFVRDNGVGIDLRHLPRLFGLFEKLDPASEGTGIGLALVRRIVEVHGGRIWAESEGPGQGTCFRFTLEGTRMAKVTEERP